MLNVPEDILLQDVTLLHTLTGLRLSEGMQRLHGQGSSCSATLNPRRMDPLLHCCESSLGAVIWWYYLSLTTALQYRRNNVTLTCA
jgi:hypothetical protein